MNVVGFAGWSGSGKTTLVEQLIALLKAAGQRVSVVKHAHHEFDIDQPGKDSFRHRAAGAFEVLIASDRRLALMREYALRAPPDVHVLLAQLDPAVDWALVEGFKRSDLPKIEIWRAALPHPPMYPGDPHIVAFATDVTDRTDSTDSTDSTDTADAADRLPPSVPMPARLSLNDPPSIARWLLERAASGQFTYVPRSRTE